MRTIKLSTAYQLVMTSLLLGACLGLIMQQLPVTFAAVVPSARAMGTEELPAVAESGQPSNLDPALTLATIVGHDAERGLWLVCCQDNQLIWLASQGGAAQDNTRSVPFAPAASAAFAAREAVPTAGQNHGMAAEKAFALPAAPHVYTLVQQRQYREQVTPRIFLYVSKRTGPDQQEGVANLGLRVKKDGVDLTTAQRTHSGQADLTWPIADERQQLANLKLEFPHVDAPGLWEVQLIDGAGQAVGPVARFVFAPNEAHREIYLHYTLDNHS
jgi:hypothetical protein